MRHYKNESPAFGIQLWKPVSSRKWTLDFYWGKHIFVILFYKVK